MDPNETYAMFCRALLEEDAEAAREAYFDLRAWMKRGGFEPTAFANHPRARRQFFTFNPCTGQLD